MFKKLLLTISLFLFLFIPQKAYAALYINEFANDSGTDWVEIYNSDSTSVDLSEYKLNDGSTNNLDLSGTISGNGFLPFDWSNRLDKDGDTIKLIKKSDESVINQITYGGSEISAPANGQTAGRNPDGSSSWAIFSTASRGATNNSLTTVPTATPTSVAATNTPTPTKTPTPVPSATPTKTPTPSPTKSASVTVTSDRTITSLQSGLGQDGKTRNPTPTDNPDSTLSLGSTGDNDIFKNGTPTPTGEDSEGQVLGASTSNIPWVFIGLGLILLCVCGILAYFQFGEKIMPKFLIKKHESV